MLTLFDHCIAKIEGDATTGKDHWLPIVARIDKGVIYWQMSKLAELDGRLELLEQAAQRSIDALKTWDAQSEGARHESANRLAAHKAASNTLYFLAAILELGTSSAFSKTDLEHHLDRMKELSIEGDGQYFKTRDNLMHAKNALAEHDEASTLAGETFIELRAVAEKRAGRPLDGSEVTAYLAGSEATCFQSARKVLSGHHEAKA